MSLINEALKKAQRDRPEMPMAPPPGGPIPPHHQSDPGPKRKHRSFLWGFLLAVLLVGGLSSLLAAYLVLQLTDPQPPSTTQPAPQPAESRPLSTQETSPDNTLEQPGLILSEKAIDGIPPAAVTEAGFPEVLDKVEELPVQPQTTPLPPSPYPPTPESKLAISVPESPVDALAAKELDVGNPPNAELIERLRNLEVRGLMSGATKVLLFDSSTGKTRVYKVGDPLGDQFGLTIHSISLNSVKFKDYAGKIHTKSF